MNIENDPAILFNLCTRLQEPAWQDYVSLLISGCRIDHEDDCVEGGVTLAEAQFFGIYAIMPCGEHMPITDSPEGADLAMACEIAQILGRRSGLAVEVHPNLTGSARH